ncbi:bifunctional 5,10-methylene-tetrahydrofolate dehydrogenase/5,10-methylene-tetrahydrofolate cyclohydrolase [Gammaproteobacteria bacterium]|jgi:methylenetetrahydrofolate dehydrogenase (NADP+)/methenyltetrahydrofolate cyclohydrolase|nr:bifunctional 5,10-methylene-tetrahydrofolate dehydrogenase/5,10-methylene-tetrahydrofolate cyclohydrolase [Gammaproteobacteria bacterium]MDA7843966.1 bifunctional 5,10-methylene-tetrahydrofolate dehydrogenase/5,10-methylene-tetrahydrofolate cyclohydrolase [Gammaproteobacteria bacterium]MDA8955466.1 bifunctional 5,10-methylene-tetrahydrofolate dehydrogenase/5,10-methylene-tetrahydrofolate cyclohydrolase [Gammaproteobacteria bacterium]MDA9102264.1 bifunctional 5,10-methylene-tetrahydrofolate de|tara:strand:- start:951 stop:1793 length:843 start_codon:yes stop_codon:yes gene_type:complete
MTAKILDGKKLATLSEEYIKKEVSELVSEGITPTLATILVGHDPASETYVKMKRNTCKRVGMESVAIELPESTTTEELLKTIEGLNLDLNVHGILLQHPTPTHIDERKCFDSIDIEKDVDGVTCLGFGNMAMGMGAYGSCTPAGIVRLIEHYELEVEGKHAVVVGRSPILGKPMAMMLLNLNATVTICHSRTQNIDSIIKQADVIVGAVGIPEFIKTEWIKKGAIVIDAGFHPEKCGDIDLSEMSNISSAYTPVPGGVGPMTINTLILHTMQSAKKLANR